jgi:hypothetical protein
MSECLLFVSKSVMFNAKWGICSYIMVKTSYILMRGRWWYPLCTRSIRWVIFIVLAHWNNSPLVVWHVVPFGHIIFIPSQPVFALPPYCYVFSGAVPCPNFIVFGLTWRGLEPTIYRIWGKHTTHYTTRCGCQ